ncbi:NUDIX domain-containing protein [Candidatus Nomurabacteria bacterium]|jgi:8-oxo-dGTP diphosphatase|nr:MAG: NUDIX domain-containing protein [Candidatus Nomurabacteria bacterium]
MPEFFVTYIEENTILPKEELLSAVFLVAIDGSQILAIENERGWDIPGGHIEKGETPEQALIREVQEEAGATFSHPRLFAIVESNTQGNYKDMVMLVYTTNDFKLGEFTPSEDALSREVIPITEFLERYTQSTNMRELIAHAQQVLMNTQ